MMMNPLHRLSALGQSVWLDCIRRDLLGREGEFARLVAHDGVQGVTSNPTIFEDSIRGCADRDDDLGDLAQQRRTRLDLPGTLAVDDVAGLADLLRPAYDASGGADGFVSIDVSPRLAQDTAGSIAEAGRLWGLVGRPNVMVKVPATVDGLPAIRKLLRDGVNVHITLLFSTARYKEVQEAFLAALEERVHHHEPIDQIRSVAGFFVSPVDLQIDAALLPLIRAGGPKGALAGELRGTIAIANAKQAYQAWLGMKGSQRWRSLADRGAPVQRLLWAGTGTRNPEQCDVLYVDALVAPNTVNTMSLETLEAYRDHGHPAIRIEEDLADSFRKLVQLHDIGIDLQDQTEVLERDAIARGIALIERKIHSV